MVSSGRGSKFSAKSLAGLAQNSTFAGAFLQDDEGSPDGGIGRRAGLKHQWSNPCRFDPGSGYEGVGRGLEENYGGKVRVTGKSQCWGCGACAQGCPERCIGMKEDGEVQG